ncbi:hypothetical protein FACS189446_0700 [Bacteroidia bacterium]|nr:hypothetical protein FACS189446_0700 [Bacteroidia bacterium]
MREKMKKMLFLMLFLLVLGAANVNSQVRIGGNGVPNGAAVLDLNATDVINNGTKTLALPRVSLASTTDKLGYITLLNGMLVYNTNAASGAGVYYWDTSKWVKVSDGAFTEADGVIGNEITDTIANGGLTRSGLGTEASPYKVGIKPNGIVNSMIADRAVSLSKISTAAGDSGLFIFSDGSGVRASNRYSGEIADTLSLRLRVPSTISWSVILDTFVQARVWPNKVSTLVVPGIRRRDLCYPGFLNGLMQMWVADNRLAYVTAHGSGTVVTLEVVCLRPNF